VKVPEPVKPVISKIFELMGIKELYINSIRLTIEVDLKISEKRFRQLVKEIEGLGFKLEDVGWDDNGYFDAIYRNYSTGENIVMSYVPVDGYTIRSITYRKQGDTVK